MNIEGRLINYVQNHLILPFNLMKESRSYFIKAEYPLSTVWGQSGGVCGQRGNGEKVTLGWKGCEIDRIVSSRFYPSPFRPAPFVTLTPRAFGPACSIRPRLRDAIFF